MTRLFVKLFVIASLSRSSQRLHCSPPLRLAGHGRLLASLRSVVGGIAPLTHTGSRLRSSPTNLPHKRLAIRQRVPGATRACATVAAGGRERRQGCRGRASQRRKPPMVHRRANTAVLRPGARVNAAQGCCCRATCSFRAPLAARQRGAATPFGHPRPAKRAEASQIVHWQRRIASRLSDGCCRGLFGLGRRPCGNPAGGWPCAGGQRARPARALSLPAPRRIFCDPVRGHISLGGSSDSWNGEGPELAVEMHAASECSLAPRAPHAEVSEGRPAARAAVMGGAPACGSPVGLGRTRRPARACARGCSGKCQLGVRTRWPSPGGPQKPAAQAHCHAHRCLFCPLSCPQRHRVLLVNAARPRGSVFAEFAVSERVLRVLMSPTR